MKKYIVPKLGGAECTESFVVNNIVKLSVSCGGGMGGSFWEEYVVLPGGLKDLTSEGTTRFNCSSEGLRILKTYDGREIMLNLNNVVKAEPGFAMTCARFKHDNKYYKGTKYTAWYLYNADDDVEIICDDTEVDKDDTIDVLYSDLCYA